MDNHKNTETLKITPAIRKVVKNCISSALIYERRVGRKLGITGEIGEMIACGHKKFSNLQLRLLKNPMSSGFDAIDKFGKTYQIKAKRGKSKGRIGRFSRHKFDFAIFVFFDENYNISDLRIGSYRKLKAIINNAPHRAPRLNQIKAASESVLHKNVIW